MTAEEAIRRAESIVLKDYQTFSTQEAREIMAGLLKALDEKALEAKWPKPRNCKQPLTG